MVDSSMLSEAYGQNSSLGAAAFLDEGNVMLRDRPSVAAATAPWPINIVADFYARALESDSVAASMLSASRMDVVLYWEKRRNQNALRRVLEALQEKYSLDGDPSASDLSKVFDALLAQARQLGTAEGDQLDEMLFTKSLEALGLWPPELGPNDRSETFAILSVPNAATARAVLSRQSPRMNPGRRAFCDGFDRLPFNLPDFPVPMHQLAPGLQPSKDKFTPEQTRAVAEAVVTTFCLDQTGLGRVKDCYFTGLLSMEEIQRALPSLVPHALVEDAVVHILRVGGASLSTSDWQDLVFGVRTAEACGHAADTDNQAQEVAEPQMQLTSAVSSAQALGNVSLSSPTTQHREVDEPSYALGAAPCRAQTPGGHSSSANAPSGPARPQYGGMTWPDAGAEGAADNGSAAPRFRGRFAPVSEPLPSREPRSEEPIRLDAPGAIYEGAPALYGDMTASTASCATTAQTKPSSIFRHVVDWSTASRSGQMASGGGHQADEGAGGRNTWGTNGFKQELAAALARSKSGGSGAGERNPLRAGTDNGQAMPDSFAWIDLGLHHECGGPYLARAFVRCCQLYDGGRLKDGRESRRS